MADRTAIALFLAAMHLDVALPRLASGATVQFLTEWGLRVQGYAFARSQEYIISAFFQQLTWLRGVGGALAEPWRMPLCHQGLGALARQLLA